MKRYVLILTLAILLNCTSCGKQAEPTEQVLPSESETVLPSESESESESDATQEPSETEPETEEDIPPIEPIGEYASAQEAFAGIPAHYADYSSDRAADEICDQIIKEYREPQALFFNNVDDFAVEIVEGCLEKVYAFGQLYKLNSPISSYHPNCPYFVISDDFAVLCESLARCVFVYEGGYEVYPLEYDEQNFKYNDDIYFYSENGEVHYKICEWFLMNFIHSSSALFRECGSEVFPDQHAMETGTFSLEDGKIVFNMENSYTLEQWSHLIFQDYYDKYNGDTLKELSDLYREYEKNGKDIEFLQMK